MTQEEIDYLRDLVYERVQEIHNSMYPQDMEITNRIDREIKLLESCYNKLGNIRLNK